MKLFRSALESLDSILSRARRFEPVRGSRFRRISIEGVTQRYFIRLAVSQKYFARCARDVAFAAECAFSHFSPEVEGEKKLSKRTDQK